MRPDDASERLLTAIEALAASSEPIHRRLQAAANSLLPLQVSDFDDPADGELLEEILRALTGVSDPTGEHGDVAMTVFSMSDADSVRVAKMIVDLHRRVCLRR